jgi:hypothetical protein
MFPDGDRNSVLVGDWGASVTFVVEVVDPTGPDVDVEVDAVG